MFFICTCVLNNLKVGNLPAHIGKNVKILQLLTVVYYIIIKIYLPAIYCYQNVWYDFIPLHHHWIDETDIGVFEYVWVGYFHSTTNSEEWWAWETNPSPQSQLHFLSHNRDESSDCGERNVNTDGL